MVDGVREQERQSNRERKRCRKTENESANQRESRRAKRSGIERERWKVHKGEQIIRENARERERGRERRTVRTLLFARKHHDTHNQHLNLLILFFVNPSTHVLPR